MGVAIDAMTIRDNVMSRTSWKMVCAIVEGWCPLMRHPQRETNEKLAETAHGDLLRQDPETLSKTWVIADK